MNASPLGFAVEEVELSLIRSSEGSVATEHFGPAFCEPFVDERAVVLRTADECAEAQRIAAAAIKLRDAVVVVELLPTGDSSNGVDRICFVDASIIGEVHDGVSSPVEAGMFNDEVMVRMSRRRRKLPLTDPRPVDTRIARAPQVDAADDDGVGVRRVDPHDVVVPALASQIKLRGDAYITLPAVG